MKTEKSKLWEAIKELHDWRKGQRSEAYDAISKTHPSKLDSIAAEYPRHTVAYKMWRSYKNEDGFFILNEFAPTTED